MLFQLSIYTIQRKKTLPLITHCMLASDMFIAKGTIVFRKSTLLRGLSSYHYQQQGYRCSWIFHSIGHKYFNTPFERKIQSDMIEKSSSLKADLYWQKLVREFVWTLSIIEIWIHKHDHNKVVLQICSCSWAAGSMNCLLNMVCVSSQSNGEIYVNTWSIEFIWVNRTAHLTHIVINIFNSICCFAR